VFQDDDQHTQHWPEDVVELRVHCL
jgi:hypothetical protein